MDSSPYWMYFMLILGFIILVIALVALCVLIFLAVYLIKKSREQAKQSEIVCNQIFQGLPQDKQMMYIMQYNAAKKNPTTAVIFALFLGGLGIHKFYLGQTGLGVLYLLFSWTYIPEIIGVIEAFGIAGQVAKYNEKKAREISTMFGQPVLYMQT
jgi:TM2 domain-containing membrane protein YozV